MKTGLDSCKMSESEDNVTGRTPQGPGRGDLRCLHCFALVGAAQAILKRKVKSWDHDSLIPHHLH